MLMRNDNAAAQNDEAATVRCIGARCGGPADLSCPLCRAQLCYACAREHCTPSASLCSAPARPVATAAIAPVS